MRFLADENFPRLAVEELQAAGHDVAWVLTESPSAEDPDILARAVLEERIVLTFDTDFGRLAFQHKLPATCGIVLFRLRKIPPDVATASIAELIGSRQDWAGNFSIVEPGNIRVRAL